ncbi:lysophospholipid acyltransferase family protein [Alysiella filiformis]|uniref:KDO2-lipid IV(A) lauroyltransferase n=1 Tax=Alysiella filiformis DSM 16848 TaxID=1120981 RepID=A0A286E590_9NEIS|nr:lysophospholipid acyltransferase family protein [Alysiella filiformis]QMT30395.1 lysophospholipid acyltransferase family protein [Alysiella filiformis]UBQ56623.1 lysophospholipid acyltransferase family protein [Alysiella filiformis DSM 16848]SOD66098.1 KDO2-lipid IV(A) lauroyltransferase [Alysiella filiformis DSM 16848]
MLKLIFQILAHIPLPILHILGNVLGCVMYAFATAERKRIRQHLRIAQLPSNNKMVLRVCQETVKSGLELPLAFFRQPEHIVSLFKQVHGWQHIEHALKNQQGLLLITPHIGSYDLAGRYISEHLPFPLTAMYKPPKIKALDKIMQAGRVRGKGKTAPTSLQGVKQIMKALRAGEATIVLPDHVPNPQDGGEGVWVDFFGQSAYTMTLAGKLANMNNVQTLFFVGERLPQGKGFALHIEPLSGSLNGEKSHDARLMNDNVAHWVKRFPQQYLFAYNRYKHPWGAPNRPE